MTAEWAEAFTKAQGEFPPIAKTKKAEIPTKSGGSYSYTYADLTDILDAIRPILQNNGLSVAQAAVSLWEGEVGIETRIYHTSGHCESFGPVILPSGGDARGAGSAITYARRYSLCAALGIAADEDTDGAQPAREPKVPKVDLADVIKRKVAIFKEWSEDERRDLFITHSRKVLDGKAQTPDEVDRVVESMSEQYYEQFPSSDEAPF